MTKHPHVALIVETAKQYDRGLLRGIGGYAKAFGPWSIYLEERGPRDGVPAWLRGWKGDGIISRSRDDRMVASLLAVGVPVVELRRQAVGYDLPSVHCNDRAIARLAADHFLERGFHRFGYCGREGERWSDLRRDAFIACLNEIGEDCRIYSNRAGSRHPSWEREQESIARWLTSLPHPAAILASNDVRGLQVLDACRRAGLSVPERIAVLGVDNDADLCELADPPLSSIDQDLERIGREAAGLLDRLMRGESSQGERILVAPRGIIPRASTDSAAIEDPVVAHALRLIRKHACDRKGVDFIAAEVGLTRRMLQRRFKAATGTTVLDGLTRARIARASRLLEETDLKLDVVARIAGFRHAAYLCSFFKKQVGMQPGEYRRLARERSTQSANLVFPD